MSKTLKSYAKKQAAEEKAEQTAPETTGESTETTAEETTEEPEESAEETTEETAEESAEESAEETTETTETAETTSQASGQITALPQGFVGVSASELEGLRTKAGQWDAAQAEYTQLKTWYANTIQISAAAKEDVTNQAQKQNANSIASQPWNKVAIDLADSL